MGTAFRRRLSAAYIVLLLAFSLPVSRAFAQNPFSFDLNLAPNTSGALEGSASLRYRWASFAETVLMFRKERLNPGICSMSSSSTICGDMAGRKEETL